MNESLANIVKLFGPLLAQLLETHQQKIDEIVFARRESSVPVLEALRNCLEPFPQFLESKQELDAFLSNGSFNGLGKSLQGLLASFLQTPADQLGDILPLVLGPVSEKFSQWFASAEKESSGPHYGITCDGCNKHNFVGKRYKCTTCADFDF